MKILKSKTTDEIFAGGAYVEERQGAEIRDKEKWNQELVLYPRAYRWGNDGPERRKDANSIISQIKTDTSITLATERDRVLEIKKLREEGEYSGVTIAQAENFIDNKFDSIVTKVQAISSLPEATTTLTECFNDIREMFKKELPYLNLDSN